MIPRTVWVEYCRRRRTYTSQRRTNTGSARKRLRPTDVFAHAGDVRKYMEYDIFKLYQLDLATILDCADDDRRFFAPEPTIEYGGRLHLTGYWLGCRNSWNWRVYQLLWPGRTARTEEGEDGEASLPRVEEGQAGTAAGQIRPVTQHFTEQPRVHGSALVKELEEKGW